MSSIIQISKRGQNAYYTEDLEVKMAGVAHKLRVEIKTDSHKSQQRAEVLRHNGDEWKMVAYIQPLRMVSDSHLSYKTEPATAADFKAERETLLMLANRALLA